jgi:hypothetical protein
MKIILSLIFLIINFVPLFHCVAQKDDSLNTEKILVIRKRHLQSEIANAEILINKLHAAADKIDNHFHIGQANNEVDAPQHSCYALGKMLGLDTLVQHLKINYLPDYSDKTSDNAFDMRLAAQSLANFVYITTRIISEDHDHRVIQWNLDCSGNFNIPQHYIKETGTRSFYQIKNDGTVLQVLGAIEIGFSNKIINAINNNPKVETISLGSGGGSVYEAIRAGHFIRSRNLETTLWNNCYSACPLVFISGIKRMIWAPYPSLGFHQVYDNAGAVPFDSQVYRDISNYLRTMEVDDHFVLKNMLKSPPQSINMINGNSEDLCKSNVATWIQRGCDSEDFK